MRVTQYRDENEVFKEIVMSFQNPSDDEIRALLQRVKTIAVVGLSPKQDRPSFGVSQVMQAAGYRIIPVRPGVTDVLGE